MKGPKSFEEWWEFYTDHIPLSKIRAHPAEKIVYHPMHGFLGYVYDKTDGVLILPRVCGDVKYWIKKVAQLLRECEPLGMKMALACTTRNPRIAQRLAGGTVRSMEHTVNFKDGTNTTLFYLEFTAKDIKY
jgi:hypothetical protein